VGGQNDGDKNANMWEDDNPIRPVMTTTGELTGKWELTNTVDETNMIEEDIMNRFCNKINLTTTSISDFIQQHFISGDSTPVFAHVYEPITGTREILVAQKHNLRP
jgi:peptide subunit release factor RF-3